MMKRKIVFLVLGILLLLVLGLMFFYNRGIFVGRAIDEPNILEAKGGASSSCESQGFTGVFRCTGDNIEEQYHSCYASSIEGENKLGGNAENCLCGYTWVLVDYCGLGLSCEAGTCVPADLEITIKTEKDVYYNGADVHLS